MARVLTGSSAASDILNSIRTGLEAYSSSPCFAVIKVGDNRSSEVYVRFKQKRAAEVGIKSELYTFPTSVDLASLRSTIESLNNDTCIHGIIIQLPLPLHLREVVQYVAPQKDIDGLTKIQQGNLMLGLDALLPCTAIGVIRLLQHYKIQIKSKKVAVVGRSNLVGKPLSLLLLNEDALVSVFHSKIDETLFKEELKSYDIICSAVGKKHFIQLDCIKENSVLVDIGVTKDETGTYGDFDPRCYSKAEAYTPSIGGVGPMTVACLLDNIFKAFKSQI